MHLTVSLQLSTMLATQLDLMCQWRGGVPRAMIIREALERMFQEMKAKRKAREARVEEPEEAPEAPDQEPYEPEPEEE